jgi:hypothetical protein
MNGGAAVGPGQRSFVPAPSDPRCPSSAAIKRAFSTSKPNRHSIADFVERAKEINACEQLPHYVKGICLYGSARMRMPSARPLSGYDCSTMEE